MGISSKVNLGILKANFSEFQSVPDGREKVSFYPGTEFIRVEQRIAVQIFNVKTLENDIVEKLNINPLDCYFGLQGFGQDGGSFTHQPVLYGWRLQQEIDENQA